MSNRVTNLIEDVFKRLRDDLDTWSTDLNLRLEAEISGFLDSLTSKYRDEARDVDRAAQLKLEQEMYEASLKLKSERLKLIDEIYGEVLAIVRDEVMKRRNTPQYANLLRSLIDNAVNVIQSNEIKIICSPQDMDVLRAISAEKGLSLMLENGPNDMLGFKASSVDGSITYDATLDSILSLLSENIKNIIEKIVEEDSK
ncbi:MAG: V-type ATP synthase subunit E [Thermocladium sp.]